MKILTNYRRRRSGGDALGMQQELDKFSFRLSLHKLLNFNDATDSYRRQNRSRGDKLRRSLRARSLAISRWTNPCLSKSQMKIKLSHQSVHKKGTTTTNLCLIPMLPIGLLILRCFRMLICPKGQLSSRTQGPSPPKTGTALCFVLCLRSLGP